MSFSESRCQRAFVVHSCVQWRSLRYHSFFSCGDFSNSVLLMSFLAVFDTIYMSNSYLYCKTMKPLLIVEILRLYWCLSNSTHMPGLWVDFLEAEQMGAMQGWCQTKKLTKSLPWKERIFSVELLGLSDCLYSVCLVLMTQVVVSFSKYHKLSVCCVDMEL